jgi:hypothetical protein
MSATGSRRLAADSPMFQHGLKIQADILQPSIFKLFDRARRNGVEELANISCSYY